MEATTGLWERITNFGRVLRGAGLVLGPAQIVQGFQALDVVDITQREQFYWALHASWVKREEDREIFHEAFRLFWRGPDRPVNRVLEELLASRRLTPERRPAHTQRRVWDALAGERASPLEPPKPSDPSASKIARLAFADIEVLQEKDFEQMTARELAEAERLVARLRFPVRDLTTRRWRAVSSGGAIDMRRTLRESFRGGHDHIPLKRRQRRRRPPPIVVLCDISGSMAGYTRMLLRFLHALTNDRDRVHTFLFGTRLSNITRVLRHRDAEVALWELGRRVRDWEGGTRIGACLGEFNLRWSRRVLGQGAWVLLITDGLDRADPEVLEREMGRLGRSARKLIWLNPLLRFSEFRPEARGIRAILPHVDEHRPIHNLSSLASLADALAGPGP